MHHKKNFVHGDVRPDNLVLCREPNRLVLIDFGSAWRVEKTCQRQEGDGVSAFYAAPEQLQQREFVDFRSDQFSASVVLYEMLTLELPYGGLGGKAGLDDFHVSSMSQSWVPPSQLSADRNRIPRWLWSRIDRIVRRGLALEPDQRYANAKDWLEDIDAVHFELLGKSTRTSRFFDFSHWVGSRRWK
jgi:serine/threonine protein kinase